MTIDHYECGRYEQPECTARMVTSSRGIHHQRYDSNSNKDDNSVLNSLPDSRGPEVRTQGGIPLLVHHAQQHIAAGDAIIWDHDSIEVLADPPEGGGSQPTAGEQHFQWVISDIKLHSTHSTAIAHAAAQPIAHAAAQPNSTGNAAAQPNSTAMAQAPVHAAQPTSPPQPRLTYRGASSVARGASLVDRGASPVDGGAPSVNRGAPSVNRGASLMDRGAPSVNRGTSLVDRGASSADRGASSFNRGASPAGRGASPVYRGASPVGRGASPAHRGASPGRLVALGATLTDSRSPHIHKPPDLHTTASISKPATMTGIAQRSDGIDLVPGHYTPTAADSVGVDSSCVGVDSVERRTMGHTKNQFAGDEKATEPIRCVGHTTSTQCFDMLERLVNPPTTKADVKRAIDIYGPTISKEHDAEPLTPVSVLATMAIEPRSEARHDTGPNNKRSPITKKGVSVVEGALVVETRSPLDPCPLMNYNESRVLSEADRSHTRSHDAAIRDAIREMDNDRNSSPAHKEKVLILNATELDEPEPAIVFMSTHHEWIDLVSKDEVDLIAMGSDNETGPAVNESPAREIADASLPAAERTDNTYFNLVTLPITISKHNEFWVVVGGEHSGDIIDSLDEVTLRVTATNMAMCGGHYPDGFCMGFETMQLANEWQTKLYRSLLSNGWSFNTSMGGKQISGSCWVRLHSTISDSLSVEVSPNKKHESVFHETAHPPDPDASGNKGIVSETGGPHDMTEPREGGELPGYNEVLAPTGEYASTTTDPCVLEAVAGNTPRSATIGKHGSAAQESIEEETFQCTNYRACDPTRCSDLSSEQQGRSTTPMMPIDEKHAHVGTLEQPKTRLVTRGDKRTSSSRSHHPAVMTNAHESCGTVAYDILRAFLHGSMREDTGEMLSTTESVLINALAKQYSHKDTKDPIVKPPRAVRGTIDDARSWLQHGYVANPYEQRVQNGINDQGNRRTIRMHADDLLMTCEYHDDIGKTPGHSNVTHDGVETPSILTLNTTSNWYVRGTMDAKMLFASDRARSDNLTTVKFLATRPTRATEEDQNKLQIPFRYVSQSHPANHEAITFHLGDKSADAEGRTNNAHHAHDDFKTSKVNWKWSTMEETAITD